MDTLTETLTIDRAVVDTDAAQYVGYRFEAVAGRARLVDPTGTAIFDVPAGTHHVGDQAWEVRLLDGEVWQVTRSGDCACRGSHVVLK